MGAAFTRQERRYFGSAQRQRSHERRGGTQEEVELRAGERPPGHGPRPSLKRKFGVEPWKRDMDIMGLAINKRK